MCSHELAPERRAEMWPVMLTPFNDSLDIDWNGLDNLVEWYIGNGADGLFAICNSSEMYNLSDLERLKIAMRVVDICAGRVPIAASATFGSENRINADQVMRMADMGVSIVVLIASKVAGEDDSDDVWMRNLDEIMHLTGDIPLGIYECPHPYHRTLTAEMVRAIADMGRFRFYKDTTCQIAQLRQKIKAVSGSQIRFMNANSPTLLDSLICGGGGYCGTGANFLPWHYSWLCRNFDADASRSAKMQRFLSISDMVVRNKYPKSSKVYLSQMGLSIGICTKESCPELTEEELLVNKCLMEAGNEIREMFE